MASVCWASSAQKNGNVTFTGCASSCGKPIALRLQSSRIVWEPSVYGGDGTETRVNLSLTANDEIAQQLLAMEEVLQGNVSTCLKEGIVKTKLSLNKVRVFDAAGNRLPNPDKWKGYIVNAMVAVKGKWETRTQTGMCLECTDIQLLEQASEPGCPF